LLDLQVAYENKDSEQREELEALGWPPRETAEQLISTRHGTPWDFAVEHLFAQFQRTGKDINRQGLREHLLLRRLAGLLLQAPLPTDNKTGREFQAALRTIPLGGVQEVSDLSIELARLDSEGFGDRLAELLRRTFGEKWVLLAEKLALHEPSEAAGTINAAREKPKRSTQKGDARIKIIAGLTEHHKYQNGGCGNLAPVQVRQFARKCQVSPDSVSTFFKKEFGNDRGHKGYLAACRDAPRLTAWLKLLNQDYSPHPLFGGNPPENTDRRRNNHHE
jgi:hypothetical protein